MPAHLRSRGAHGPLAATEETPDLHELGGRVGLALPNTVLWRRSDAPIDLLADHDGLVRFAQRTGCVDEAGAAALRAAAAARPDEARAELERTVAQRERLYRLFNDLAGQREPAAGDLAALDAEAAEALGGSSVEADVAGGFRRRLGRSGSGLDAVRGPVAVAAQELLLTPGDLDRLKQCPGPQCGWLFVDESRNRSRRWCEGHLCGNRDRVRRHAERKRRTRSEAAG